MRIYRFYTRVYGLKMKVYRLGTMVFRFRTVFCIWDDSTDSGRRSRLQMRVHIFRTTVHRLRMKA